MKTVLFSAIALLAVLGMALGDDSYSFGYGGQQSFGYEQGFGYDGVAYLPTATGAGKSSRMNIGSFLPILFLCFLLFSQNPQTSDRIVLVNSSLTG